MENIHTENAWQAFRLIQASETIKGLLVAGISEHELPTSERLCREIRKLSPDQQAPVWRAVLRQVQLHGRKPTVTDVQDSAVEVIKTPSVIERQQTELLQRARGVVRGLKFNIDFVAMTPAFREKFVDILSDIVARVQTLILSLTSPAVAERVDKKDSDRTCTQIKESAK